MLNKLKAHLFAGGAAGSGAPSTPPSTTTPPKPRYIPNLYPVGDTTVETYFRRLLRDDFGVDNSVNLVELAREDVVAAAIHMARADHIVLPSQFVPLLTRCITADYDTLQFADDYMAEPEEAGVSALATPALLQILVAVALKHRHPEMLRDLLRKHGQNKPQSTLFETVGPDAFRGSPRGDAILDDPHYGPRTWAMLAEAGWAKPLSDKAVTPPAGEQPDSEQARHAIAAAAANSQDDPDGALRVLDDLLAHGLDPQPFTGWILGELVKNGTPAMVAHFLAVVTRKVYDGVPPRPKWPGMQSLVAVAAARPAARASGASEEKKRVSAANEDKKRVSVASEDNYDNHGYGVLRVLIEIGGVDIHTESGIWYKAGPDDEHPMSLYRSTRLADGNCADDPPLLAAVHAGNVASVLFLLERGVADRRKGVLDEAIKRAREQQNAEMEGVLQKWKTDKKVTKGK